MNTHRIAPNEEVDLVREARSGIEKSFLRLYEEHRRPVFQFAWRLTGSQNEAEDITQECFLAIVRGSAFDVGLGGLRTYLFGIVRNLVMRRYRISEREAEEASEAPCRIDLLGDLLRSERSEHVAQAIAQLPLLQREALVLFTYEELSLEEIAAISGVDSRAVKSRLHRARESLRAALAPLFDSKTERKSV